MDQDIPQSSNEQQLLEEVVRCRELVLQNPCEHKADLAAVLYNLGEFWESFMQKRTVRKMQSRTIFRQYLIIWKLQRRARRYSDQCLQRY